MHEYNLQKLSRLCSIYELKIIVPLYICIIV